jgi:cyclopropane fatty-acyl-phospholipid synthase-like methyltransferase
VAEFIHVNVGLKDAETVDIGAGEGVFLQLLSDPAYGARVFGIEPSAANCKLMLQASLRCFKGSIEAYLASPEVRVRGFDRATIVWTLENTSSCRSMMAGARSLLKDDGFLTVATGSRILVPFKKPLHYFLTPQVASIHPFFFSTNALRNLFGNAGFTLEHVNRYIDTDYLVMIGRAARKPRQGDLLKDDWRQIIDFFQRWHDETQSYYADA